MPRRLPLLPAPPAWLAQVPLAHRGLWGADAPENSRAAFAAAASAGVGVELDVHLSADGVPVVVHDPDVGRVAERPGLVAGMTAAELGRMRLRGGDEGVPTLAAALDALGDAPAMVEVKNLGTSAGPLERAVARVLAAHDGPTCVASFNPRSLAWFATHAEHVARVQTSGPLADVPMPALLRWSLRTLRWLRSVRPCAVSYELAGLDHPAVQSYRGAGGLVVTWTVRDAAGLARARRLADNVVFEAIAPAAVWARGAA